MERPIIAIVSRNRSGYSETFVEAHKNFLSGKIYNYYLSTKKSFPINSEGEKEVTYTIPGLIKAALSHPVSAIGALFNPNPVNSFLEKMLITSFKKNGIQVVLAEYGTTGGLITPVCRKLNIPLIVHFHGFDASVNSVLAANKLAYQHMFSYASYIIAVSQVMYNKLIEIGAPAEKLVLNHYGPRDSFLNVPAKSISTSQIFFSIGRFVEKKAPYLTILAFSKVLSKYPDAKLRMGGDGDLLSVCENLVDGLGIRNNVEFIGVLNLQQVETELENCLAYVQHSVVSSTGDMEGTPLAVLEASAAVVPVISTLHAGIPDVIINGVTGILVEEKDVNAMATAMEALLNNPSQAHEMGLKGRQNIIDNFSLKRHINAIDELVSKAVKPN